MKKPVIYNFLKLLIGIFFVPFLALQSLAAEPFKLEGVAGLEQNINFQDYAGQVILVDFWASWCGPCRQSFPWMNAMQAKYAEQGLKIVAINLDSEVAAAREFLAEVPANFTLGFDPEGNSAEQMQVEAMPMSYLIDRDGQIRYRLMGFNTDKKVEHEAHIQHLLNENLSFKPTEN